MAKSQRPPLICCRSLRRNSGRMMRAGRALKMTRAQKLPMPALSRPRRGIQNRPQAKPEKATAIFARFSVLIGCLAIRNSVERMQQLERKA